MKKIIYLMMFLLIISIVSAGTVTRSFSSTSVNTGGSLTITYSQAEGDSYGIVQDVPSGWTASGLSPDGKYRTYVDSGADTSLILTAPSSATTSTFIGEYFVYPSSTYTQFTSKTITVGSGNNNGDDDNFFSKYGIWLIIGGMFLVIMMMFSGKKR